MKAFIWLRVDHLTDLYHHEAGALAVAPDLDAARGLVRVKQHEVQEGADAIHVLHDQHDPDFVLDLVPGSALPSLTVFPDAGCC